MMKTHMQLLKQSLLSAVIVLASLIPIKNVYANDFAWQKLNNFVTDLQPRPAGSYEEKAALNWLMNEFSQLGLLGKKSDFSFRYRLSKIESANYEVTLPGKSAETIIIAAHYDSVKNLTGVSGFIDNASGAVTLIALAEQLKNKTLPYTVKLVALGAEEVGLQGAKAYVNSELFDRNNTIAMINLDTVIGGDYLYVHSAHSTEKYDCDYVENAQYSTSAWVRDGLFKVSKQRFGKDAHKLHPANKDYPEGETGGWSDHAPFACSGVPIAYIEATNFDIIGKDGQDGYSQSTNPKFWNCFDEKKMTSCNKKKEKNWGMIWHTEFDQPKHFLPDLEAKMRQQYEQNIAVITEFVIKAQNFKK